MVTEVKLINSSHNTIFASASVTERKDDDKVRLSCSASSPERCYHRMKWLYKGQDVAEDKDMETSQSDCSAAVTFHTTDPKMSKDPDVFTCEGTDYNGKVQQFTFSRQSSGEKTGENKMN